MVKILSSVKHYTSFSITCSSVQIKSLQCVMEQQGLLVNPKYRTELNNQFYSPYQNHHTDYSLRSESEFSSLNELVPLPLPLCLENTKTIHLRFMR